MEELQELKIKLDTAATGIVLFISHYKHKLTPEMRKELEEIAYEADPDAASK